MSSTSGQASDAQLEASIQRMVSRWQHQRGNTDTPNTVGFVREPGAARSGATAEHVGDTLTVIEPPRVCPVLATCEVLVVGGGPSGLSAALGARRAGADTILMERFGCFGGVITTVGMETMGWYRYEGTVDCEGVGREMERVAERMGATSKWPCNDSDCLDAEKFKIVADRLITEVGVRPLLHCYCVDVIRTPDGAAICGVITESKSGRLAVLAQRIVDCTGDADLAHFAGCPTARLSVPERMGCTTVFSVAGVDCARFRQSFDEHPKTYADWSRTTGEWKQETTGKEDSLPSPFLDLEFNAAAEKGILTKAEADQLCGSWSALSTAGEATNLNLVHMKGFDTLDVNGLTGAEMEGRRRTPAVIEALRAVLPGFESCKLRNFGTTIGVRDTRKIVGRHQLSSDEVRNQARFEDAIGIFPEFIDGYNILILPNSGRYFQVPYGCTVPLEGPDNLLVAGRCVAGDKTSHAAMRNMMACTVTGQGAGVAAAVSLKLGVSTRTVDIAAVQSELRRQGVRLD